MIKALADAYRLRTGDYGHCPSPKRRGPLSEEAVTMIVGSVLLCLLLLWLVL